MIHLWRVIGDPGSWALPWSKECAYGVGEGFTTKHKGGAIGKDYAKTNRKIEGMAAPLFFPPVSFGELRPSGCVTGHPRFLKVTFCMET